MVLGLTSNSSCCTNPVLPRGCFLRSLLASGAAANRFSVFLWRPIYKLCLPLLRSCLPSGNVTLVAPDGAKTSIGDHTGEFVEIRVSNYSSLARMLINPLYSIGSEYVRGNWHIHRGQLADALTLIVKRGHHFETNTIIGKIVFRARRAIFLRRQVYDVPRSFRNSEAHYDVASDLFEAFLDEALNYTCADFENGPTSLDCAQENKLRNTLRRLSLEPGHSLLEIGCGWGALSRFASNMGAAVTALTLSKNQLEYSQLMASKHCNDWKPRYLLEDYRQHSPQHTELYDRIVSVGMLEHVGHGQLHLYFSHLQRLLKPNGVALVHTIARNTPGACLCR